MSFRTIAHLHLGAGLSAFLFLWLCLLLWPTLAISDDPSNRKADNTTKVKPAQASAIESSAKEVIAEQIIAGELIAINHVQRTGTIRPDRTDAQRRGDWDLPIDFTMLPFGSISYHGAPAELRHIPIGTHIHGVFRENAQAVDGLGVKPDRRMSPDAKYNLAMRLEDDFTRDLRLKRSWKVDAVTLGDAINWGALTVTANIDGTRAAKSIAFQIGPTTRVWRDRSVGSLTDLQPGQEITFNLTYCTLKGPGRCVEIWLDDQARQLSTDHQMAQHRLYMREHGLPGMIEHVNNEDKIVTLKLFDGFDISLLDDFPTNNAIKAAQYSPPFVPGPGLVDPMGVTAAVAEENLRTWDQINDRKAGPILERISSTPSPGYSGVGIRFCPSLLLEGFRPGRIIRIWPSKWKVDDLPREERLYQ